MTAPLGFRAAGVAAGLKSSGERDVAVVLNDGPSRAAAGVFTSNRVKAAPVLWTQQVLRGGRVRAVALNSGGANACTGPAGLPGHPRHGRAAGPGARRAARAGRGIAVCSTGLIGERLPMDLLLGGLDAALAEASRSGGTTAADAIRTTDTVSKIAFHRADGYTIGGMAKGAGMLAPGLATMLCVLTTDADLPASVLDSALRAATQVTFDRLDTDGCMSTNDTVLLLASGATGHDPRPGRLHRGADRGVRRPGPPVAGRRRGREQADRGRGGRRGQRAGRGHRRPRCSPVQPAQVRDRGRGPELGPGALRGRHHGRRVRAGPAQRRHQRCLGVP